MKLFMLGVLSLCFFMFMRPSYAARPTLLHDDMWGFDYPLVLTGKSLGRVTEDLPYYVEYEFPIYIGYITLGYDRTFTFTKETDHPIERLEEVLRRIEATGEVPLLFDGPQFYPDGKEFVTIQEKDFTRELNRIFRNVDVEIVDIINQGQAKNYDYSFKIHYVRNKETHNWRNLVRDYMENTIKTPKNPQ